MAVDLSTYLRRILPRLREMAPPAEHPELEMPCLLWTGARRGHESAYGAIWYEGKSRRVHRVVWRVLKGAWPPAELAHVCDRTLCCELSHVREATHAENMGGEVEPEVIEPAPFEPGEVPF